MRATLATALFAFVFLAVLLATPLEGPLWADFLSSTLVGLATVVGAWAAPASYHPSEPLFARQRSASWHRTKRLQFVVAAVVANFAHLGNPVNDWFQVSPPVAGIVGIVAALFVGALLSAKPSQDAAH